jgi:hypothetical protein
MSILLFTRKTLQVAEKELLNAKQQHNYELIKRIAKEVQNLKLQIIILEEC